jgi:hypothetical protein
MAGHGAKVENHAVDSAIQEAFAPRIFPGMLKQNPRVGGWKNQAEQVYQNWMHAHSLDESAINYDGPGRLGAVKRPQRFPMEIHFVWGFCMGAQGA